MSGWLRVVGLGPGPAQWLTPEAHAVLYAATDVVGYFPYVENIPPTVTAKRHASDNGDELERANEALRMAAGGRHVAVVSGGDAGVFGMASAVFEALENGDPAWRKLDISVVPGVSAMLAAAARAGAPLGHDFCVISLSDYLKPWAVIEQRLHAACDGDLVLALYNPASQTRRETLIQTLDILKQRRGEDTIAIIATSIGRKDEQLALCTLGTIDPGQVNMKTLLIIGSSRTRRIERDGHTPYIYTPRYYSEMP